MEANVIKIFLALILIIGLAVAGASFYFVTYRMDGMIASKIESAGSSALGTHITIGTVNTGISAGSLQISNVSVANPPGYDKPDAISLDGIEAEINYDGFDITRLVIEQPSLYIEEAGGTTNFSELLEALETHVERRGPDADTSQPRIVIRQFRMNESQAKFESKSYDMHSDVRIDSIEMENLEGTVEEVAIQIARRIVEEVATAAAVEVLKAKAGRE